MEYWSKETDKSTNDARGLDVDLIRAFTQDADNFLFQKLHLDSKPDTLKTLVGLLALMWTSNISRGLLIMIRLKVPISGLEVLDLNS